MHRYQPRFTAIFGGTSTTGTALTATDSYVTASVSFYDAAGRDIDDVNYGRQDVIAGVATAFFNANGTLIATNGNPTVSQGTPPAARLVHHVHRQRDGLQRYLRCRADRPDAQ